MFITPAGLVNKSRIDQKQYKKYKDFNSYNTCYINSSLQCLFRLDKFINNIFIYSGGKLVEATKNLINKMINKYKYITVSEIKEAMSEYDEKYGGINPEDANEFITDYLDILLEETRIKDNNLMNKLILNGDCNENYLNFLNRFYKYGKSFISDLFYGILKTEMKCVYCKNIFSIKYHSFSVLDLSLNQKKTESLDLKNILSNFVSEKEISNLKCKCCNNNIHSKTLFYKLPNYLIMHIGRNFSNNFIINKINVLNRINMNFFMETNGSGNLIYNLKGIIYYSFLEKNKTHYTSSILIEDKWYYFDDNDFICTGKLFQYKNDYPIILFYEIKE